MSQPSGGPDAPPRNGNNISYLQRAMPMKFSVKGGNTSN